MQTATASRNGTSTGRKTLYHSELVKLGTVRVKLLSEPHDSTFPGKAPYCFVQLEGSEAERTYHVENDGIYQTLLHAPQDQWLTVVATGSRDAADLDILERNEHPAPGRATAPAASDRAPTPAPAPAAPSSTIAGDLWRCLSLSTEMVQRFRDEHGREPTDAELRLCATLFIELGRGSARPLSK